ncbi:cytidine deaminase [Shewanella sp. NIFS-20-20]|uniref:cytidine deaminase n=1 Tax=Shewanella sp. NIFS-20-20 TaxID=2853806 RepID=UPI001C476B00|nr:cytidine deaminase [Shewanella sp. NIFS-20-20]MBV7314368.1 cytidine deaminase [Shewanella sp. NIFS-20-20]
MPTRFTPALDTMSSALADSVRPLLTAQFDGTFSASQLAEFALNSRLTRQELYVALLTLAATLANPPISQFRVGALAIGASGRLYMGANLELPQQALGHSVHAEQSAISHAWIKGETAISDIIVNASPCGHCRQFINELYQGQSINIHLPAQDVAPLSHYLPYAFGPSDLGINAPLLQNSGAALAYTTNEPLYQHALIQAGRSYAPYSACHAAVVIEMRTGEFVVGRYAENAAFNPSLMPMQMALSLMNIHRLDYQDMIRAVLVESNAGQISLFAMSRCALASVADIELEYLSVSPS